MRRLLPASAALLVVLALSATAAPPFRVSRTIDLGAPEVARLVVADFDGDGLPDLARPGDDEGGVVVHLNRGDATFDALPVVAPQFRVRQLVAGDLDGDGAAEVVATGLISEDAFENIVVVSGDKSGVVLFRNDGTGTLEAELLATWSGYGVPACLADLEGDGDLDIAWARWHSVVPAGMETLLNDGTGLFAPGPLIETRAAVEDFARFVDLDDDGLPELHCGRKGAGSAIFWNLGGGAFGPEEETLLDGFVADVTGDGLSDLVTSGGRLAVGKGGGRFESYTGRRYDLGSRRGQSSAFADVDGDSDPDLVVESFPGFVSVLENEGGGVYGRNREYRLADEDLGTVRTIAVADFDGDGVVEILVQSLWGTRLLTPGGEPAPAVEEIEPAGVPSGERHVVEIRGEDFTPTTTVDFGPGNEVVELEYVGPELLVATIDVAPYAYADPGMRSSAVFDVVVEDVTGGSTRLTEEFWIRPYWDHGLVFRRGKTIDLDLPGLDRFRLRCGAGTGVRALLDQAGGDLAVVFGSPLDPSELVVPGDDPGWRVVTREGRVILLSWESPEGSMPRFKFRIKEGKKKREIRLYARDLEFPGPQGPEVWVEIHLGTVRVAGFDTWKTRKPGRYVRRKEER